MNEEPLLTVRAVAARLGVSISLVYKLVERGELRHVKVRSLVRIRPSDLDEYLGRNAKAVKP